MTPTEMTKAIAAALALVPDMDGEPGTALEVDAIAEMSDGRARAVVVVADPERPDFGQRFILRVEAFPVPKPHPKPCPVTGCGRRPQKGSRFCHRHAEAR